MASGYINETFIEGKWCYEWVEPVYGPWPEKEYELSDDPQPYDPPKEDDE